MPVILLWLDDMQVFTQVSGEKPWRGILDELWGDAPVIEADRLEAAAYAEEERRTAEDRDQWQEFAYTLGCV